MERTIKKILRGGLLTAGPVVIAMGMSVILCLPALTAETHAFGHINHYGMDYLAEHEAREKMAVSQRKEKIVKANARKVAEDMKEQTNNHVGRIALRKK